MRGVHTTSCALFIDMFDEEYDVMMDQILAAFQKNDPRLDILRLIPIRLMGISPLSLI